MQWLGKRDCERGVVDRKEALPFVERQKLLHEAARPRSNSGRTVLRLKIRWFRKIFGNFIPNFRELIANEKHAIPKPKSTRRSPGSSLFPGPGNCRYTTRLAAAAVASLERPGIFISN